MLQEVPSPFQEHLSSTSGKLPDAASTPQRTALDAGPAKLPGGQRHLPSPSPSGLPAGTEELELQEAVALGQHTR
eukprot:scaffold442_cov268-Pinguiococcus_pyrenoidosus.AAC.60